MKIINLKSLEAVYIYTHTYNLIKKRGVIQ